MIYTEADMKQALEQFCREWDDSIDTEYGDLDSHHFSKRFERKMKHMIRMQSRTSQKQQFTNFSRKVAVVLIAVVIGLIVTTISVEAYREQFIRLVTKVTHRSTDYDFVITTEQYFYADLGKTIFGYIPDGFIQTEDTYSSDAFRRVRYENDYSQFFKISFSAISEGSSSKISVDTENSEFLEFSINGETAVINYKNGNCTLIWSQRNVLCHLFGNIDKNEALKIAEGINVPFEEDKPNQ